MEKIDTTRISNRNFISAVLQILLLVSIGTYTEATIFQSKDIVQWTPGVTVGSHIPFPVRNNLINVTQPPYNADNTGASSATAAIQSAINAAASNDVIYLPTGKYLINGSGSLTINKSWVTFKGDGPTNTIILGLSSANNLITVGHDAINGSAQNISYVVTNGTAKGSYSLSISNLTDAFSNPVGVGDILQLSQTTRNIYSNGLQVISVVNYDRLIRQWVVVTNVSGSTVSISDPLVTDFTNSPRLLELAVSWAGVPTVRGVVLSSFSVTQTNAGSSGSSIVEIYASCTRDCYFTNLDLGFANNYQLEFQDSVDDTVTYCNIHDPLSSGTSHGGLLLSGGSGIYCENTIFGSTNSSLMLFPAIEFWGITGCSFFGNFFTNNLIDILGHNTHPMMNLFEENVMFNSFEDDSYFGSQSHQTLFRNRIPSTVILKRWALYHQIVGNDLGPIAGNDVYYREDSNYGAPFGIFEFGFPNIGNSGYLLTNPPVYYNWPQKYFIGFSSETITNGIFTITNALPSTNVIWTFNGIGQLTNIPSPIGANYGIVFQRQDNTNVYEGDPNGSAILPVSAGTSSNVTLSISVPVSSNTVIYVVSQNAYQQLQFSNKTTHLIHGNLVYTNVGGTLVWDPGIADHAIPTSLTYTNPPSWWGTNRYPAVTPELGTVLTTIPAQDRFNGIAGGGGGGGGTSTASLSFGSGTTINLGSGAKLNLGQ